MTKYRSTLGLVLVLALSRTSSASSPCPISTAADWQTFLQNSTATIVSPYDDENYGNGSNKLYAKLGPILQTLDDCHDFVAASPVLSACTANFDVFAKSQLRHNDPNSMGWDVDNLAYIESEEAPDKPAGMETIPGPLNNSTPGTLDDIAQIAKTNGWKYVIQQSALSSNPRTFINIPGDKFDQWILYDGPIQPGPATLTAIITVQKQDSSGRHLSPYKVHFRDLNYGTSPSANVQPAIVDGAKCYSCHPAGVRPLITYQTKYTSAEPVAGEAPPNPPLSDADFGLQRIKYFNNIMRAYGPLDFDGAYLPQEHGPALGAAQGCTGCHDGHTQGILTFSTSTEQIQQKLVNELSMPPSPHLADLQTKEYLNLLSAEEKTELANAQMARGNTYSQFMADRPETVKKWVLSQPCF